MEEGKSECGFLHCKLDGDKMSFEFIPIGTSGGKKTKKRKRNKKRSTRKYK